MNRKIRISTTGQDNAYNKKFTTEGQAKLVSQNNSVPVSITILMSHSHTTTLINSEDLVSGMTKAYTQSTRRSGAENAANHAVNQKVYRRF